MSDLEEIMKTFRVRENRRYFDTAFAPDLPLGPVDGGRVIMFGGRNIGRAHLTNMLVGGCFPSDATFMVKEVLCTLFASGEGNEKDKAFLDEFQAGTTISLEIGEREVAVLPLLLADKNKVDVDVDCNRAFMIEVDDCHVPARQCMYAFLNFSPGALALLKWYKGSKQLKVWLRGDLTRDVM